MTQQLERALALCGMTEHDLKEWKAGDAMRFPRSEDCDYSDVMIHVKTKGVVTYPENATAEQIAARIQKA